MEVRIYDRDLNFKGVIENHTSLIWTRKYYEPGNFEIHAPITEQNLRLLAKGNIISKRGSSEAGVIEDIENEESDLKNENHSKRPLSFVLHGSAPDKIDREFSGKIEVAMRNLLSGVTAIPLVELGTLNGFTETVEFQATMKNLMTYETKLAKAGTIGYRFRPDFRNRKIIFETYKGTDRTTAQGINSRVIFRRVTPT